MLMIIKFGGNRSSMTELGNVAVSHKLHAGCHKEVNNYIDLWFPMNKKPI